MSKTSKYRFPFALAACLFVAQSVAAADGINRNLVSVDWLDKHLHDANILILDASSTPNYAEKHIPGAISADVYTYGIQEVSAADTERLFQSWGVSPEKTIILYDQGGSNMATRSFFSLYHAGFPARNLAVLDGGLSKWQEKGFPVTTQVPAAPRKGSFTIKKFRDDVRVRLPEFLAASGDPGANALVEALGPDWHFGEKHPFPRAGHIPNGILMPGSDFYNADKTFKSPDEIRKMASYLGIRPEQQVYTYCGGGVAASVPFFALKFLLDYPKVKLYQESEVGWISDERELPYWTYDAPFLLRDMRWLQFWAGRMLRTYIGTNITVVDVRSVDEFNQGHIPFALNIPADTFKSSTASPDKLARLLGPAGVHASHEAVVVSGAGLTKDAALAFVMLEKLGQKRVSVLIDPVDKWTQPGFAVTKDATAVGPKKSPTDLSIVPTDYAATPRKDVIIADPKSTNGVYPKVFIASGANVPAKAQDGKVVHVPYTDLLNADGTPKAAKDIWSILAKAGVPRYAELVCFSDDPGEAAANYFILKLMGFPDIKVLVI